MLTSKDLDRASGFHCGFLLLAWSFPNKAMPLFFPEKKVVAHAPDEAMDQNSEPLVVIHAGVLEPAPALDELPHGELQGHGPVSDDVVPRPADASGGAGPGALVLVLPVEQRPEREFPVPLQPPFGVHVRAQERLHVNRAGVGLPGPAQERRERLGHGRQVAPRHDAAPLQRRARVLVRVLPALRRDRVLLGPHGPARGERAVLEHGRGVAEDEVHRAGDEAAAVELPELVRVERVLVPVHAAAADHGAVRAHTQGHRLVLLGPRRVLDLQVLQDDPVARHGCTVSMLETP